MRNKPRHATLAAFGVILRLLHAAPVAQFRRHMGYLPNLAWPKTWHEKMLWRKLIDHNPQFTLFCDKLATKDFIRARLPDVKIPETLWVGHRLEDAPRDLIDAAVVIKTNHGSSFNHFPAREAVGHAALCRRFANWMNQPYGTEFHEWGYSGVERKIFIERLVPAPPDGELLDISIECADGQAIYGYITIRQKQPGKKLTNYSPTGEAIRLYGKYHGAEHRLPDHLPVRQNFLQAVRLAEVLSQGLDYIRVDFLGTGTDLYAGEITCYPMAGISQPTPAGEIGTDTVVTSCWDIGKSWFLRTPQRGWKRLYAAQLNRALSN